MSDVIVITGASRGLGLAMATHLTQAGHRVIGSSRRPTDHASGFPLLPLDVTDAESIAAFIGAVMEREGRIDVLINNVGYDLYGAVEDTSMAELRAQMETNFFGAAALTRAVLPLMRAQQGGKIINISSLGGLFALPFNSAYSASKFALEGFSESLRFEMLPFGVYVSLVEAGAVRTDTLETSITHSQGGVTFDPGVVAARAREQGQRSRLLPADIVRVVSQITADPTPRLRYIVGSQAALVSAAKRWLPWGLLESALVRALVKPVLNAAQRTASQALKS